VPNALAAVALTCPALGMLLFLNVIDTWHAITSVLLALASGPQFGALLRRDPEQIGAFVDEILRFEPPENGVVRMCTRDTIDVQCLRDFG
jgi:cytochrome P450